MLWLLVFWGFCLHDSPASEIISATESNTHLQIDSETVEQKKLDLSRSQKIIVFTSVGVSFGLIITGGILTLWCRKRNQPRIIDIEQVMLSPTEEMYATESL